MNIAIIGTVISGLTAASLLNNHHKASTKINFAHKWFEIDLGYLIAFLLQKLNIIQLNKVNKV